MALSVATGRFTVPGSAGLQSITGVGFQPKALIFFGTENQALGTRDDLASFIGFAASATERSVMAREHDNAVTSGEPTNDNRDDRCCFLRHHITTGGGAINYGADFDSFDADGFTLDWITPTGEADIVFYIAIGGDDLTDVSVGQFTKKTSIGTDAITGVGFQPDVILIMGEFGTVLNASSVGGSFFMGCGTGPTSRWVTHGFDEDGVPNMDTGGNQRTDKIIIQTDDGGSLTADADLDSLDADGFTLDYITADGNANQYSYLALKGGSYDVGSFNGNTSIGNQAVTGVGFLPIMEIFRSYCFAASASQVDNMKSLIGAGISSSERSSHWWGSEDSVAVSDTSMELEELFCLRVRTDPDPLLASADFVSQDDSDGFTVDWDTVDAISREILYLAMADAPKVALPSPALATWTVLSPTVTLGVTLTPTPAVATWAVAGPANVSLGVTLIQMPAVARWIVASPSVTVQPRGIGGDMILDDIIEKTIVVPD